MTMFTTLTMGITRKDLARMTNQYLTRQSDLINQDLLAKKIGVVGAGAIGSFTCLSLAKMGCDMLTVWDDDKVTAANMNCQFYRINDIGCDKVTALNSLVHDFTGIEITPIKQRVIASHAMDSYLVISAVDSMQARMDIFKACQAGLTRYLIDPRMSAEYAQLHVVDLSSAEDIEHYKGTLYSDAEAVQERCTAKSTIYTANLLSGYVVKVVKSVLCNTPYPVEIQWSIKNDDLHIETKGA